MAAELFGIAEEADPLEQPGRSALALIASIPNIETVVKRISLLASFLEQSRFERPARCGRRLHRILAERAAASDPRGRNGGDSGTTMPRAPLHDVQDISVSRLGPRWPLDAAIRHLLRHLHNGKELRRNPIASTLLDVAQTAFPQISDAEVAAAVFAQVDGILSEIKQRSQNRSDDPGLARAVQIVERCVVGREQWKVVARELGISNRQYARDRAQIVVMITRSLLARSAVHSNSQVQCVMTAALNSCIALSERGSGNAALERLFEMAADSTDLPARVAALSSASQIAIAYGKLSTSAKCARRLDEAASAEPWDGPDRRYADAARTLIDGERIYDEGDCGRGITLIQHAVEKLRASATEGVPGAYLRFARALTLLGEAFADRGFFSQGEEHTAESLRCLARIPNASSAFEVHSLNLLSLILMAQEKRSRQVEDYNARAQALATKDGLLNQLAWSLLHQAQLARGKGHDLAATKLANECLETIRLAANNAGSAGKAVAAVASLLSTIAPLDDGALSSMVELLSGAIAVLAPACGNWVYGHVTLAEVELRRNRPKVAKAYAEIADAAAASVRPPQERARTLSCLAEVEARLGSHDRAQELVVACMEFAERYERPRWLARHRTMAARLTVCNDTSLRA